MSRYFALADDGMVYDLCDCGDFDAAEESAADLDINAVWIADEETALQWANRVVASTGTRSHLYAWAYANTGPDIYVSSSFLTKEEAVASMLDDVQQSLGNDWEEQVTIFNEDDGTVFRVERIADIMLGESKMWLLVDLEYGTASE